MSEANAAKWSSRFVFVMAAAGAAVGLGNIWKFPYTAGVNGGGAFVLIYVAAVALISFPMLVAELVVGRHGSDANPIKAIGNTARSNDASEKWGLVAVFGMLACVLTLGFYFVIAGWIAYYAVELGSMSLVGQTPEEVQAFYYETGSNSQLTTYWQTGMILFTLVISILGMRKGMERIAKYMMPLLFLLLIICVIMSLRMGDANSAIQFLFDFRFDAVSATTIYYAVGQAFFTVGAGSGVMIVFGSRISRDQDLIQSAARIAALDTSVALLAGLAIFPLVFAYGLAADEGPGLLFVTMAGIFADLPGGAILGSAFFFMVAIAALTSAIAIVIPPIEALRDWFNLPRALASIIVLGIVWLLGLGVVCSFDECSNVRPLAYVPGFSTFNILQTLEVLAIQFFLPLSSLLLIMFVGWKFKSAALLEEVGHHRQRFVSIFIPMARYFLPPIIFSILVIGFLTE